MQFSKLFLLACVLFFSLNAFAVLSDGNLGIYAVISNEDSALKADLHLHIASGTGKVYSRVGPLVGTSTQSSEQIAVLLAKNYFPNAENYDYFFEIASDASIVDGPSAGSAMALLAVTQLTDRRIPSYVGMTGTIGEDGSIGPVGGVFFKAQKASETGIKLFMIPFGEAQQTQRFPDGVKTINLTEYALQNWGLKVVEVQTLDDAITLAFTDLEDLNVSALPSSFEQEFIPTPVQLNEKLMDMQSLTERYLDTVNGHINSARGALSSTILSDQELVNTLLESLNSSDRSLTRARTLYDQNYLYSSANTAFIAMVNALLVEDISENPSLMEPNSVVLGKKLLDLQDQIERMEKQLNQNVPVDHLEWFLSTQERIAWAKLNVSNLLNTQTVYVNSSTEDSMAVAIDSLRDYEFARAWLEIAGEFYSLTINESPHIALDSALESVAENQLQIAENAIAAISDKSDIEDITRRLDAGNIEHALGWNVSAALDAASATALANATTAIENKNVTELESVLDEKITALETAMRDSGREFIWPQLYLDHAKFFLNATRFYQQKNQTLRALDAVKGGVSLVYLAESVLDVIHQAYQTADTLPAEAQNSNSPSNGNGTSGSNEDVSPDPISINLVYVFPVVLILLIALLLVYFYLLPSKSDSPDSISTTAAFKHLRTHILEVQSLQVKLDKDLASGKIGLDHYKLLQAEYVKRLNSLQADFAERSKHLLELDKLNTDLKAAEKGILELRKHFVQGFLTQEEYMRATLSYSDKIKLIQARLDVEKQVVHKLIPSSQPLPQVTLVPVADSPSKKTPVTSPSLAVTVAPSTSVSKVNATASKSVFVAKPNASATLASMVSNKKKKISSKSNSVSEKRTTVK